MQGIFTVYAGYDYTRETMKVNLSYRTPEDENYLHYAVHLQKSLTVLGDDNGPVLVRGEISKTELCAKLRLFCEQLETL